MSDLPARGEGVRFRAEAHAAAAACLGVCLLAGTALPGLLSPGARFPAVSRTAAGREADTAGAAGRAPAAPAPAVDINRAAAADLQALPGIGPTLARRIVAHREAHGPFRSRAELLQVPGVGAKRLARLQGLIRVAEAP